MTKKAKPRTKKEVPGAPDKQGSSTGSGQEGASAQSSPPAAPPIAPTQTGEAPPTTAPLSSTALANPQEQTSIGPSATAQPSPAGTPSTTVPLDPSTAPTTTVKPVVDTQIKSPKGNPPKSSPSAHQQEKVPPQSNTKTQTNQQIAPPSVVGTTANLPAAVEAKQKHSPAKPAVASAQEPAAEQGKLPFNSPTVVSSTAQPASPSAACESPLTAISPDKPSAAAQKELTNGPPSVPKTSVQQSPDTEAKPQDRPSAAGSSPAHPHPSALVQTKLAEDHRTAPLSDAQPLAAMLTNPPSVPHPINVSTAQNPAVTQANSTNKSASTSRNSVQLPTAAQTKPPGKPHATSSTAAISPEKPLGTDVISSQPPVVKQTKPPGEFHSTVANISFSHHSDSTSKPSVDVHEPSVKATKSPAFERDLPGFTPEHLPDLMTVDTAGHDKVPEDVPPEIVSAVVKEVLSELPTKKPAGKQNNRENPAKQPVASKLEATDKTPESKSAEAVKTKAALAKTVPSKLKDKQKEQPIKKGDTQNSGDSDSLQTTTIALSPGITEPTVKQTTSTKEKLPTVPLPQDAKSSTSDNKTVGPESLPDSATNKPGTEMGFKEESNKKAVGKKNRQISDANLAKTDRAAGSKKSESQDPELKNKDSSITENAEKSNPETKSTNIVDVEKTSLKQSSDKAKKPQKVETTASDIISQNNKEESKVRQQSKATQDSQETKKTPAKEDQQSKSVSKKKNKQRPKSSSEDMKPPENKDTNVTQETAKPKGTEKSKPKPTPTNENHKTPIASSEMETGDLGNLARESGLETGLPKAQLLEMGQTVPEQRANEQVVIEQENVSKKKKRNRHKKKNKMGDDENGTANVASEKTKATDARNENKTKEISSTKSAHENGHQKDVQTQQSNKKKSKQLSPGAHQDEESLKTEGISEEKPQTPASKKRKRRKNKTAEKDKDAEESKPEVGDIKSNKQEQASEPKLPAGAEGVQKKKNGSKSKSNSENEGNQTESHATLTDTGNVDGEDQQEKFVEVKSKSKRNKKSKVNETREDSVIISSMSSDVSNSNPQTLAHVSNVIEKDEKPTVTGDRAKVVTNRVAAPKLSPEAREQKMLKKKLAERAQQKIQQQIESNCLSEAEKSEKYLETITKNLKELTKLRSSKLEDILQKSAADGEEEFDYEYSPVQRTTFLATTCHICKESKPKENLRICNMCHMISYCSEEHQKSDWAAHKDLCHAVAEICKEKGTNSLFVPAAGLTADDYRAYRMNILLECSAILNRPLEPYEQEMILYPYVCQTCHLPAPAKLQTCDKCEITSYCSPEHRQPNHDVWCPDLQLFKSLIVYQSRNGVINPQLPEYYPETIQPPVSDMQSLIQALLAGRDASLLERVSLSEIATGPLTTLFALYKANKISESTEKLVVHFVGAEWSFELERADKWEAFLLHLVPNLKSLVLVFVGPEVASLPEEAMKLVEKQSKVCSRCQDSGRKVELTVASQFFYHEYAASANYVKPDVICAFNAGLYRHNGYKEVDSWADTLEVLLKDRDVLLVVTSYTAEEMLKDVERLQQRSPLNFVLGPSQNPYRSLRPNRNFASDDVTPVIFKNFYITITTSPMT